jgi:hypothetical protein
VAGRGENGIGKATAAHADCSAIRQTKAENFSRVGAKWPQYRPPAHLWCSPWHLMQPLASADVTVARVSGASDNRFHFSLQCEFDGR